jgi:hypothetical protein
MSATPADAQSEIVRAYASRPPRPVEPAATPRGPMKISTGGTRGRDASRLYHWPSHAFEYGDQAAAQHIGRRRRASRETHLLEARMTFDSKRRRDCPLCCAMPQCSLGTGTLARTSFRRSWPAPTPGGTRLSSLRPWTSTCAGWSSTSSSRGGGGGVVWCRSLRSCRPGARSRTPRRCTPNGTRSWPSWPCCPGGSSLRWEYAPDGFAVIGSNQGRGAIAKETLVMLAEGVRFVAPYPAKVPYRLDFLPQGPDSVPHWPEHGTHGPLPVRCTGLEQ